jgi:hypothetical protein
MIPQRSYRLIETLSAHSDQLSQDALDIFTKACKPHEKRDCAGHDVTDERLKDLLTYINLFKQSSAETHFHRFIDMGFNLLHSEAEWAKVEQVLYEAELNQAYTRRGGSVLAVLNHLAKTYFDDQELWSPSRSPSQKKVIDFSTMYVYPIDWVLDFKKLTTKIFAMPNAYSKYKSCIGALRLAFSASRFEPYIVQFIADGNVFNDALDDDEIFKILISKTQKQNHSRLHKIRSIHSPALYGPEAKHAPRGKYNLLAGSVSKGAYWIHELSPKWFKQCQNYVDCVYQKYGEREAISTITRLTKTSSAIVDHKDSIPNLELLKNMGISAFFEHDQALIKAVYDISDNRIHDTLGETIEMYNALYDADWTVPKLMEFAIRFNCSTGDDRYRYIILDILAKKFRLLVQNIADYAHYELKRFDGYTKSDVTTFGAISSIHSIFNLHLDDLTEHDLKLLAEHGVDALKMNDCQIIKRVRYTLKRKFKDNILKLGTVTQFQSHFKQFCSHFDLPDVMSHAVRGEKRKSHELKSKVSDYYTLEDVATLAYAIEMGLQNTQRTSHEDLLLRIGRILLKTGWNLTPTLMLEIDDIMKLDAPLAGKVMHFVRLYKKRGNYQTQFYQFDMDADAIKNEGVVFGSQVTNALADLEYIRDKISHELRAQLPSESKLKYRLSLYRDGDGCVRGLAYTRFTNKLAELLSRYDCNVRFNTQRIRKGGLNYIYKKYSKNFKEYQKAGQHSLEVFLDVYLRDDGLKSDETLASATTIMSDYFSGRPITDDIIIVTEIPADTKQTPSGRCASKGNDAEADAYSKKQQRLNRDSETTSSQCGDFNACLFCRHFRLVADAEHVWRLLSYHRYVVGEMERGVSDYDNTTDQANYIEILNKRVNELLAELNELNSDAVNNGRQLMNSKGCHQDWSFFAEVGAV